MRLVFAGTPEFSVPALDALHAAGHGIAGVFTQPDRPAGRGRLLQASAVSRRAEALGIQTFKPVKFDANAQADLRALAPELMVVVAYGLILPQAALDIPPQGCLNIHASLLPRWRGAAPVQRAILAGDRETGVTIMRMEAGLDTGPMLRAEKVAITETATAAELHDTLSALGARLIAETVAALALGTLVATPQPEGATYAPKIGKDEARIDWSLPAAELARRVRAYNPVPVAWTQLGEERLRIHVAHAVAGDGAPGTVMAAGGAGIEVATGAGRLAIDCLQWPGGKPLRAEDAARGRALIGQRLV